VLFCPSTHPGCTAPRRPTTSWGPAALPCCSMLWLHYAGWTAGRCGPGDKTPLRRWGPAWPARNAVGGGFGIFAQCSILGPVKACGSTTASGCMAHPRRVIVRHERRLRLCQLPKLHTAEGEQVPALRASQTCEDSRGGVSRVETCYRPASSAEQLAAGRAAAQGSTHL
jgi:hypothetical protein